MRTHKNLVQRLASGDLTCGLFVFAASVMIALSLHALVTAAPPDELPSQILILQPGIKLTLLAEHPDLVTPTGVDVDKNGNIWVVACHTHFRPSDYEGLEHDEILVFDQDGKNRRVFYNKTNLTMNLKLGRDGWVYLALRDRILRVKDTDGDGKGEEGHGDTPFFAWVVFFRFPLGFNFGTNLRFCSFFHGGYCHG